MSEIPVYFPCLCQRHSEPVPLALPGMHVAQAHLLYIEPHGGVLSALEGFGQLLPCGCKYRAQVKKNLLCATHSLAPLGAPGAQNSAPVMYPRNICPSNSTNVIPKRARPGLAGLGLQSGQMLTGVCPRPVHQPHHLHLQGYLAHKKHPPAPTTPLAF